MYQCSTYDILANLYCPLLLEWRTLIKIEENYYYCKKGIKYMWCIEGEDGRMLLKPKAKVEQNLKVKCLWLTCYGRLNMTRLINLNWLFLQKDYLWGFPSVHLSDSVYTTYSFAKQKYFAQIEMLYNIPYIS